MCSAAITLSLTFGMLTFGAFPGEQYLLQTMLTILAATDGYIASQQA
jgi:hypothetical protein